MSVETTKVAVTSPNITTAKTNSHSKKINWSIIAWFAGPVIIRLLLMPLNNQWDAQTWYSMFADFKFGHSPYATMQTLSFETRAENIYQYYEYFAYPPGLIYIYWPIAKLYALLDPNLNYSLVQAYSLAAPPVTWYFNYFFKLPTLLADIGVMALLWKMGGREVAKRYAWSPYVIMIMIWMFDPLMVFSILWAVYALERKRTNQAALALAIGTIIKYVPMFIFPAIILYLVRQKYSFFQIVRFCAVYAVVCAVAIAPFLQGTLFTFQFQTDRFVVGLTWQQIFLSLTTVFSVVPEDKAFFISAFLGTAILPIGMLLIYAYTYRRNLTLTTTVLVTLLGYLVFTKIVNEVYAAPIVPLMLLELKNNPSPVKERYYKLIWAIPFAWAIIKIPAFHFFIPILSSVHLINYTNTYNIAILFDYRLINFLLTVVGISYSFICLSAITRFAVKDKAPPIMTLEPATNPKFNDISLSTTLSKNES